jgi:predicted Zn-dependent protease
MSNSISIQHTTTLELTSEQEDILAVQILQKIYIDAHQDWEHCKADEREGIDGMFSHPDDKKRIKSRLKSSKKLLDYYMYSTDLDEFLDSVEHGFNYTFNPDKYK